MPSASTLSGYIPVSFTREQLAQVKVEVANEAPYASRISLALAVRLAAHPDDRFAVLRGIDALEGLRPEVTTKPAEQFKYPPLAPLWHKHYFTSRHVIRNVGDRWDIARGTGNHDFRTLLSDVATNGGHDPARWPGELVHRLVMGGLMDRAKAKRRTGGFGRLTGDWIIFGKHEGQNYYLDLAAHKEGQGQANSERLMGKLRAGSQAEFPFLF